MLTSAAAKARILVAMRELDAATVTTADALGRVLRETIVAERDQPPFDRVTMDGIAIAHADFAAGRRSFPLQAMQAAGDPALTLEAGKAIEIMTGAVLPQLADCVIPVERISVDDGSATLDESYAPEFRQFIHPQASDHARGAELLRPGKRVTPLDIAVIASAGRSDVAVSRQPVVRIVSTGNELVAAGAPIQPHQVRLSNGPALTAMLQRHGHADCAHEHLEDDPAQLRARIGALLEAADVLVLSGGVSMGKADFVPSVLAELGVVQVFHRISQRPGKPMWFGTGPRGQAVFALPGNPVSALVCCRQYVIPALARACGAADPAPEFAALAQDIRFQPELTCFQPVRLLSNAAGQVLAMPVRTNTSGDFTALAGTDGYVELALEQSHFPAGTAVPVHRW